MANSISDSEVVISSAIEVLDDLLAPLGNFTLNVANDYAAEATFVYQSLTHQIMQEYTVLTKQMQIQMQAP